MVGFSAAPPPTSWATAFTVAGVQPPFHRSGVTAAMKLGLPAKATRPTQSRPTPSVSRTSRSSRAALHVGRFHLGEGRETPFLPAFGSAAAQNLAGCWPTQLSTVSPLLDFAPSGPTLCGPPLRRATQKRRRRSAPHPLCASRRRGVRSRFDAPHAGGHASLPKGCGTSRYRRYSFTVCRPHSSWLKGLSSSPILMTAPHRRIFRQERHRARRDCLFVRMLLGADRVIGQDGIVDRAFDACSSSLVSMAGWVKSKRRRSGATSEPAWWTCSPRI